MWLFEDREYDFDETYYGFVYLIENLDTGRKYVGRKYFTSAGYKTVNKKRKKIRKESDWRDYYGSSPLLKEDVEKLGKDKFKRTILHLCKTRASCSYFESKEIFVRDALLRENYYNGIVQCRINHNHMKDYFIS